MQDHRVVFELGVAGAEVRPWRRGDEASLAAHADNRKVWQNLRDAFPHPYTLADAENWISLNLARTPLTNFAIAVESQAAGAIGFNLQEDVYRRSAEIGFWLGEAHWGRGITTAALQAVTDYAFAEFDLCRVYANVFEWNVGSMRVLEKAGYVREACLSRAAVKNGRTIDVMLYAKVRSQEGEDR